MLRKQLIIDMAGALRTLSNDMLNSGTAQWGAYERAGLINYRDHIRTDPARINANTEGIIFPRSTMQRWRWLNDKERNRGGISPPPLPDGSAR
jgi:hypothetical protein